MVRSHARFPNSKVLVMDVSGSRIEDFPTALYRTIDECLVDEADREKAIKEYKETMQALEEL